MTNKQIVGREIGLSEASGARLYYRRSDLSLIPQVLALKLLLCCVNTWQLVEPSCRDPLSGEEHIPCRPGPRARIIEDDLEGRLFLTHILEFCCEEAASSVSSELGAPLCVGSDELGGAQHQTPRWLLHANNFQRRRPSSGRDAGGTGPSRPLLHRP
ncbi:hypothetical protein CB1_000526048 [Camelus ferus]|nr:hypothetical protein CB1_000526048 [Camelus ferus]